MSSFLNNYLNSKSLHIVDFLKKKNRFIQPWHILVFILIVNAIGLMNLLNNKFSIFIVLLLFNQFCLIIESQYKSTASIIIYFHNVIEWVIIISVYMTFTQKYNTKITTPIVILVIILLLICNLHFMTHKYNKKTKCIELWNKCIKRIVNIDNLKKINNITKYFDEYHTIIYLIIIMIYIHNKK